AGESPAAVFQEALQAAEEFNAVDDVIALVGTAWRLGLVPRRSLAIRHTPDSLRLHLFYRAIAWENVPANAYKLLRRFVGRPRSASLPPTASAADGHDARLWSEPDFGLGVVPAQGSGRIVFRGVLAVAALTSGRAPAILRLLRDIH